MFSILRRAGSLVGSASRIVSRVPGVSMIPGVGTALGAVGLATGAYNMLSGGGSSGSMPGLPTLPGGANQLLNKWQSI